MLINDEVTQKLNKSRKKRKTSFVYEKLGNLSSQSIFKDFKLDSSQQNKSIIFTILLVFGSLLFLTTRAFSLQIIEGKANKAKADQNTLRHDLVQPYRGAILDRSGQVLVRNAPSFAIQLDMARCRNGFKALKADCASDLRILREKLLHTKIASNEDILQKLDQGILSYIVAKDLSKEDAIKVETEIESRYLSQTLLPKRDYLYPEAFAHVLGFVGIGDTVYPSVQGKDGIEKYYDLYLKGIPGEKVYRVDSFGEIQETVSEKAQIPGSDLQLSLDRDIQLLAYDLLSKKVDDNKVFGGAVVAQDPRNGEVLALVSYPTFDSKKLSSGLSNTEYAKLINQDNQPFFNRAIAGAYPPGSTFKMVTSSAGLMEGTINDKTTIFDPGYIKVGNFIFRNWKLDGHGNVDIYTALQKSNDTFFYTVGGGHGGIKGVGIKKLSSWANKLGYGKKTGIDLYGEVAGFIPNGSERDWYLGDDFISAIGQGDLLATPLQVNNATVFFANGGKLFKPHIIKNEGSEEPIISGIVSKTNYDIIRKGMLMSVEPGGTGYPFFDFESKYGFKAAGKTGTSEFINKFGEPDTHGWFTVFAPYDEPTIAVTVFLEGGSTGSDDAAVLARKIVDKWIEKSINTRQ